MADADYDDEVDGLFPLTSRLRSPEEQATLRKFVERPVAPIILPSDDVAAVRTVTESQLHEYVGLADDVALLAGLATLPLGGALGALTNIVTAGTAPNSASVVFLVLLLIWSAVLAGLTIRKMKQVKEARDRMIPPGGPGGAAGK